LITATGHTDIQTAGAKAGAKLVLSLNQNMETPLVSQENRGKRLARVADRFAGKGCWKKQKPFCDGADRKRQLLCDKQADFQQVMKDEKAGRTIV
jgi:CDGSH-type Zn-finger protein